MRSRLRWVKMDVTAVVDHTITPFQGLFTLLGKRIYRRYVTRTNRRLAVAPGNVNHVIWLAEARHPPAQRAHNFLAMFQRRTQMRGSRRKIAMVQVIGLNPAFDKATHQRLERGSVVIDAAQQNRLADHWNTGVNHRGTGGARLSRKLPGVVGVQR